MAEKTWEIIVEPQEPIPFDDLEIIANLVNNGTF